MTKGFITYNDGYYYFDNNLKSIDFLLSGVYDGVSTPVYFDPPEIIESDCVLSKIVLIRRTAGTDGITRIDVKKNNVSIFDTNSDMPQVLSANGDNAISSTTTFNTTSFSENDVVEVFLDSVESYKSASIEGPEGLRVKLYFTKY